MIANAITAYSAEGLAGVIVALATLVTAIGALWSASKAKEEATKARKHIVALDCNTADRLAEQDKTAKHNQRVLLLKVETVNRHVLATNPGMRPPVPPSPTPRHGTDTPTSTLPVIPPMQRSIFDREDDNG